MSDHKQASFSQPGHPLVNLASSKSNGIARNSLAPVFAIETAGVGKPQMCSTTPRTTEQCLLLFPVPVWWLLVVLRKTWNGNSHTVVGEWCGIVTPGIQDETSCLTHLPRLLTKATKIRI